MDFYVWKNIDNMIDKVKEFKSFDEFKSEIVNAFEKFREKRLILIKSNTK